MSATREELLNYLNNLLQPYRYKDYCPNGLQVEGKSTILRIVSGVTACLALIDAAILHNADLLLVHHGYFWKGEEESIRGMKRERLKKLLKNDINLVAYHLPLDGHPVYGNNIQLAEILNLTVEGSLMDGTESSLVLKGSLPKPMSGQQLTSYLKTCLSRTPLHIPSTKNKLINSVAWCTGGAQGMIQLAIDAGVDAYITGEISEKTVHIAREENMHFFAAGHHATERYGVKALGEHLAQEFDIEHHFVDIDSPV